MILFFNTYLTPTTLKHSYNRGMLKTDNKVDVFKYAIESIAPLQNWSQVIIQFELAPEFSNRYDELTEFIKNLFPNQKNLYIKPGYRNTTQKQWQKTVEQLEDNPDKLVFFSCNHDHIFMDSQTEYFNYCVDYLRKYENEYSVSFLSGYLESIEYIEQLPYQIDGPLVKRKLNVHDGFLIVTKSLLREWWCKIDLGDVYLPRTDEIPQLADEKLMYNFFVLGRDMFAHYDGYHNLVKPRSDYMSFCPSITIPPGYFDNNIKINYNFKDYRGDCVNINLTKDHNSVVVGEEGSDYFLMLGELPMVWKNKISDVYLNNVNEHTYFYQESPLRIRKIREGLEYYTRNHRDKTLFNYFLEENVKFLEYQYGKRQDFKHEE